MINRSEHVSETLLLHEPFHRLGKCAQFSPFPPVSFVANRHGDNLIKVSHIELQFSRVTMAEPANLFLQSRKCQCFFIHSNHEFFDAHGFRRLEELEAWKPAADGTSAMIEAVTSKCRELIQLEEEAREEKIQADLNAVVFRLKLHQDFPTEAFHLIQVVDRESRAGKGYVHAHEAVSVLSIDIVYQVLPFILTVDDAFQPSVGSAYKAISEDMSERRGIQSRIQIRPRSKRENEVRPFQRRPEQAALP